jgi:hypothetical protein
MTSNKQLSCLNNYLHGRVVYRNLEPDDPSLNGYTKIHSSLGIQSPWPPRKSELDYGRVVANILGQACHHDQHVKPIHRLLFIGDTRMNDGMAFENICAAGDWSGRIFIGKDDFSQELKLDIDGLYIMANRWASLEKLSSLLATFNFPIDERTAVVIDIDKTAIGARGRNDKVIDAVRLEAAYKTLAGLLGDEFSELSFQQAYNELGQPTYHPFTADNQDYLVYICLFLGSGMVKLDDLLKWLKVGKMNRFVDFLNYINSQKKYIPGTGLVQVHQNVWDNFLAGDPTPFKAFRFNEYHCTIAKFGDFPGAEQVDILKNRIVLTREVRDFALEARRNGALIFGLSDKPDEAAVPTQDLSNQGFLPLHKIPTLVV